MSIPQTGIFALGTRAHHHLEFDTEIPSDLAPPLAKLNQTITSVAGVNMVFGFGSRLWAALHPHDKPADLEPFEPIVGSDGFTFPATQHDLWIWLHGGSADTVFDRAREVKEILGDAAVLAAEQSSRVHGASLDLTGFEDGTENPHWPKLSASRQLIPDPARVEASLWSSVGFTMCLGSANFPSASKNKSSDEPWLAASSSNRNLLAHTFPESSFKTIMARNWRFFVARQHLGTLAKTV